MRSNARTTIILLAAALSVALAIFAQGQGGGGQAKQGQARQGQGQQQQQQVQPPGTVTGVVVNAKTGEPLRKVLVTLRPSGRGGQGGPGGPGAGGAAASSDNSGEFRITGVPPGTYTLTGERTGFVRAAYGEDQPGGQARTIEVTSNQTTGSIQLKLMPHSVIMGRVYDQDGDPVENAQVQVMRYTYARGGRQLSTVASGSTNDLGEFRVAGLAPGRYYVSATGRGGLLEQLLNGRGGGRGALKGIFGPDGPQPAPAEPNPEEYVTTYYPRSIESNAATPIDLVAGSEVRGIDIGLLKRRTYTVSGVIDGVSLADLQPPPFDNGKQQGKGKQGKGGGRGGVAVILSPRSLQANLGQGGAPGGLGGALASIGQVSQAQVNPQTGAFQFKGVQPGSYYLTGQTFAPGQQDQLTGRMPVDVASGDVTNLTLRLQGPIDIKGKILPEKTDSNFKMSAIRLNLQPAVPTPGGRGGGQQGRIEIAENGAFETRLAANIYNVQVTGAPQGYYLKSVKLGGREVPDAVLDLSFSGGEMEVVLGADAGNITGRVERSNGDAVPNVRVTAVPVSGSSRQDLYKAANSSSDGTFTLQGLPPGGYRLFAWEEIEGNAWMDPDFRRPFEPLSTTVTIANGLSPNATVRVIGREQMALAGVQ
jgi:protocatechuate 3,4-dioxygenase beta subunit